MSPRRKTEPREQAGLTDDQAEPEVAEVSPEEYAAFIRQVELQAIWLVSAKVDNRYGTTPPPDLAVEITSSQKYEPRPDGFDGFASYLVTFGRSPDPAEGSVIEVTFGLRFRSEQPMTDVLFRTFGDVNLPVNAWPFLREFLQSVTARMNWPVLTIQTFKVGTGNGKPTRTRRARPVSRPAKSTEEPSGQSD